MAPVMANKQSGKRYHELGCDVNFYYVWMDVIERCWRWETFMLGLWEGERNSMHEPMGVGSVNIYVNDEWRFLLSSYIILFLFI